MQSMRPDRPRRAHVDFGLSNPELHRLITARGRRSPAVRKGVDVLRQRIGTLADAGVLRVSEQRALEMIHAAGMGVVHALLETPPEERDLGLAEALFEAVLNRIVDPVPMTNKPLNSLSPMVTFAAQIPRMPDLSEAERVLLTEWVRRSIDLAQ